MSDGKIKVFTIAHVPPDLAQAWLQHLRDFDVAHPRCHFEVLTDPPPDISAAEMIEMVRVTPGLTFSAFFEQKKPWTKP